MIKFGEYTHPVDIKCYEGVNLTIGKFCSIASGLKIISGQHPIVNNDVVSQYPFKEEFGWSYPPSKMDGKVTIGNDVWIGEDVSIIEGITIGDGAIVGACSVVAKDVPEFTTVVGNPARIIKVRKESAKWWNWKLEAIKNYIENL